MTNAEIIEAATLGLAVYSLSDTELETVAGKELTARWDAAIEPLQESGNSGDLVLIMMAVKLLGGGRYGVNTDNVSSTVHSGRPVSARNVSSWTVGFVFLAVSHSSLLKHTARRILANGEIPYPNWSRL
jgi:hypothetical protein